MTTPGIFLILSIVSIVSVSCHHSFPVFRETVIDDKAPQHLWMKTIGDLNGDGKVDMVVGGWKAGGLVAYLAPDWKKITINDSLRISTDAEVSDIDNDNMTDVIAITGSALVWFSGPDWNVHNIDSIKLHDVEVADFDGNGLPDVVGRNQSAFGGAGGHALHFYYQGPAGVWTKYQNEIVDGEGLEIADLNGDGKTDIITNAYWFENTGTMGSWKENKFSDTWSWPHTHIDVADINGDGRPDILHAPSELAGKHYHISWFEAPKTSTDLWVEHVVVDSIETVVHSINAADFDGDGKIDIVIAEMQQGADPDEVAILYNKGNDSWTKAVISTGGCHSMRVFDADGDGDPDIFGANFAEGVVRTWVNEKE